MRTKRIIGSLLLALCIAIPASSQENEGLSGEKAAQVEAYIFTDWYGNEVAVSSFEGKIVIIDIWESWCAPCTRAFPVFQQVLEEYPDDIVFIAATCGCINNRTDVIRFKNANDYDFLYVDGSDLAELLEIETIPYKIVIDRNGRFQSVLRGFHGEEEEYETLISIIEQTRN